MGQEKTKRRLSAQILQAHPWCCYCGGNTAATTVDHVPAKIMFLGKRRPNGLEVPACISCNRGTKSLEQAAALFARLNARTPSAFELSEVHGLSGHLDRSFPGWKRELLPLKEQQELEAREKPAGGARAINMGGPLVRDAISAVGAKVGFALHFKHSGKPLSVKGGVEVAYDTDISRRERPMPDEFLERLGPMQGLRQGAWTSDGQFSYQPAWQIDGDDGMYLVHLGAALTVLALVYADISTAQVDRRTLWRRFLPGDLKRADERAKSRHPSPLSGAAASGHFGFAWP